MEKKERKKYNTLHIYKAKRNLSSVAPFNFLLLFFLLCTRRKETYESKLIVTLELCTVGSCETYIARKDAPDRSLRVPTRGSHSRRHSLLTILEVNLTNNH